MNQKFSLIFMFLIPVFVSAQFNQKKYYNAVRVSKAPKIDGLLNDQCWNALDIANDFTQIEPNNGKHERINQTTEVKICYDNKNIYFGVILNDNAPDSILTELSKRDVENKNFDSFSIFIDPFNNAQIEYNFTVTAAGVQIDRKFTKIGIDKTWNAVWKSEVAINKNGWVAEIAIPFSQIRFPDNNKSWALNMSRSIRRYREKYSWNPINIEYNDYSLQAGLLNGISDINSPLRLSLMPYTSIYRNVYNKSVSSPYNYGIDLKYGINESFTLDMTLIPDFGQVPSDALVLNLSPYEVKYEEKRQFFNEGTEMFDKGDDMFYSRRLQDDLINASKITGRTKYGLGISMLNAITNTVNESLTNDEDSTTLTNYNIIIFDQSFNNGSSVSIMNTNMIKEGNSKDANVSGLFARINNKKNTYTYLGGLKISQEFDNLTFTQGYAGNFGIRNTKGKYRYNLHTNFKDEKYNSNDLGFLYSNNEIRNILNLSYTQFKENNNFIDFNTSLQFEYQTLFTDQKFVDFEIEIESKATLKNYTTTAFSVDLNPFEKKDYYESRTGDFTNPVNRSKKIFFRGWLSSDYRDKIAVDLSYGTGILPLYNGYIYRWRISPRYRVNDKISLKYVLSTKNTYNDIGFVTNDTLSLGDIQLIYTKRNTNMITNVMSLDYNINNKIDLSMKLRYHMDQVINLNFNSLSNDGYLQPIYNEKYYGESELNYTFWTSDIIFNWWFAPGSQLSIVWKNGINNEKNQLVNHWIDNVKETYNLPKQNSLSLKVIYYLDYLYFSK